MSSLAAWGLVAYGVRLAAFLAWRQRAWPEWKERAAKSPEARAKNVLAPVLGCGVFYALMCSPALWALRGGGIADASALAESDESPARLGGKLGLCEHDFIIGAWAHTLRSIDQMLSETPLDWHAMLPCTVRWLDESIMPRLRTCTATGYRYQMLGALLFQAKMPQLAARMSDEIWEDIKATRELVTAQTSGMLAF